MISDVEFNVIEAVAVITVNRPHVRNAIDRATAQALSRALDRLDDRRDVRAGVLTGAGGTFCAGMDLKAFSATGERPIVPGRGAFGIVERPPAKPLIAAVEGKAFGGGFEIALACDLIVAAADAQFALPEVTRGLVAAAGGVLRLPQRMPRNAAMELILCGTPIGADTAYRLGLANRVVPAGSALREAAALAAQIAANAPLAVRTAKFLVNASSGWPAEDAFARQTPHTDRVRESADASEGARAFIEKRPPVWSGC